MGTAAVTNVRQLGGLPHFQSRSFVRCTITPSASYATGGETIPLTALGLASVDVMLTLNSVSGAVGILVGRGEGATAPNAGFNARLGGTAAVPKLQAFVGGATAAELAAAQNISTESVDVILGGFTK